MPIVVTAPDGVMRRTRLLPISPTYTFENGSTETPKGLWKTAAVPCPSTQPSAPLPASVLTFQKQGGGEANPGAVHAVAGEHAAQEAGGLAYVPTGHVDALYAQEVAPAVL